MERVEGEKMAYTRNTVYTTDKNIKVAENTVLRQSAVSQQDSGNRGFPDIIRNRAYWHPVFHFDSQN